MKKIIIIIICFLVFISSPFWGYELLLWIAHGFNPKYSEIDKCLDAGGRWNYEKKTCEKGENAIDVNYEQLISGEYGCKSSNPVMFKIIKNNDSTYLHYNGKTKMISGDIFNEYFNKVKDLKIETFKTYYGKMKTTADFHGQLIIKYRENNNYVHKNIKFIYGTIDDRNFEQLLIHSFNLWNDTLKIGFYLKGKL